MQYEWHYVQNIECLMPEGVPEIAVRSIYFFYERKDVNQFLMLNHDRLIEFSVLVPLGYSPISKGVNAIQRNFVNARFNAAFGKDLPAMVLICRIALWLKQQDASFFVSGEHLHFVFKSVFYSCPIALFSLNRFCRMTGFRTDLRTVGHP